ncbi:MAG: DUF4870 domain-containing protein [Prosthecobacter sp.]
MASPAFASSLPVSAPTQRERVTGIIMHLLGMPGIPLVGPLVMWLACRRRSSYLDGQGRELLNFHLSFLGYAVVLLLARVVLPEVLALLCVVLLVGMAFVWFFLGITGVLHAWLGKVWRFPLAIRLL